MDFYTILNGIRQTLRMAAVKTTETDGDAEVEVITPVIRLAGTEAENGVATFTQDRDRPCRACRLASVGCLRNSGHR